MFTSGRKLSKDDLQARAIAMMAGIGMFIGLIASSFVSTAWWANMVIGAVGGAAVGFIIVMIHHEATTGDDNSSNPGPRPNSKGHGPKEK